MDLETAYKSIQTANLPAKLKETVQETLDRLKNIAQSKEYYTEYDSLIRYIDWVVSLPWERESQDQLDLNQAKEILDQGHYGLEPIKERIFGISIMSPDNENDEMKGDENIDDIAELETLVSKSKNSHTNKSRNNFQKPNSIIFGVKGGPDEK